MIDLLPVIVPSLWAKASVLVWMAVFVAITLRVFCPALKDRYETFGNLPLDD